MKEDTMKIAIASFMAAVLAVSAALAAQEAPGGKLPGSSKPIPRIVKFAGGQTEIDSENGLDHVVVKDAQGEVSSESWCEAGTFDDYFAFFTKLKEALAQGDRKSVVKLVSYPFQVNAQKPLVVRNEASLLKSYDRVFTPPVLETIGKAEAAAVFCRDGAGMLGNGVIWATGSAGSAKATVLNP
jgi:hypothetical protein